MRAHTPDLPIHFRTGLRAVGIVNGRPVWPIKGGSEPPGQFELPADLSLLSDADVEALEAQAEAELNALFADKDVTPDKINRTRQLSRDLDVVKADLVGRRAKAADAAARANQELLAEQERLRQHVQGTDPPAADPPAEKPVLGTEAAEAIAAAVSGAVTSSILGLMGEQAQRRFAVTQTHDRPKAPLSAAQQQAPGQAPPKLDIVASVQVPDRPANSKLETIGDLAACYSATAKGMGVTADGRRSGPQVARVRKSYEHTLDERSTPAQVDELVNFLTSDDNKEALVAGGGWCAPPQTRYDFFNIAGFDGGVDMPEFGVQRGGIIFPTSPSLADAVFDVGSTGTANKNLAGFGANFDYLSSPWLWTETTDIATVTGAPNKPVVRVPCPSFSARQALECYGIILTAGNLTDDAYPEATQNTLRLLNAAHDHVINARYIAAMVSASSAAITISGSGNRPIFNQLMSGMAMAMVDYREKFGMESTAILEIVLPRWVIAWVAADLAYRPYAGADVQLLNQTRAEMVNYFAVRGGAVQFVGDWQVRTAGLFGNPAALPGGAVVAWPTSVQALVYAAGTFIRGNGLTLDFGVIRDSVLNAENDFTAAFTEECHLIAKVGHESRLYTVGGVVNGSGVALQATGAYI
jgi:hypothetical protein